MIHISIILHHNMGMKTVCMRIPSIWVCFFLTEVLLPNGYIFRPPTHTSGQSILELPPPPPPGTHPLEAGMVWE